MLIDKNVVTCNFKFCLKKIKSILHNNMSTSLDQLTKKLYDEGVGKANAEAEVIIAEAQKKAEQLVAEAKAEAQKISEKSVADAESLKKKSESEIAMAVKNAETTLKQAITNMLADSVAAKMSAAALSDKKYVQELIIAMVNKWNVADGSLDLAVALSEEQKAEFAKYVAANYKELLDKGLEVKVGNMSSGFSVGPKDGSYQIAFTEELFNAFFSQYLRGITKELLYSK